MQIAIKIFISVAIILTATAVGKRFPSIAGLVAVMPLTGALVLVWMYIENNGNPAVMQAFTRGALWGLLPTILFFFTAFICFRKPFSLPMVLAVSFGVWLGAALLHQLFLK